MSIRAVLNIAALTALIAASQPAQSQDRTRECKIAPNNGSDSLLMKLRRRFSLVSQRNQRHAVSSRIKIGPAWVFG
jgi:hypothetical protein